MAAVAPPQEVLRSAFEKYNVRNEKQFDDGAEHTPHFHRVESKETARSSDDGTLSPSGSSSGGSERRSETSGDVSSMSDGTGSGEGTPREDQESPGASVESAPGLTSAARLDPEPTLSNRLAQVPPLVAAQPEIVVPDTLPLIYRTPRPSVRDEVSMHLCPVATELFKDIFHGVQPPEFLTALVGASEAYGDSDSRVEFEVETEGSSCAHAVTEKAVRAGSFQCQVVATFLGNYGQHGLPPRPANEIPGHVLYIGIPCFTEHPEEILPTIESILLQGGYDSLRVHIVLAADITLDPRTRQRIDTVPFGITWQRLDGRFTFTYLNKGLAAFTGKTSSLYLISKYVCARISRDAMAHGDTEEGGLGQSSLDLQPASKNYMLMADTRIIYGTDSVTLLTNYMRNHNDVIACTGTQELYPVRFSSSTAEGMVEGTATRKLEERRPSFREWLGAPSMQQFEFEANYAVTQFAYHHGGRLTILPGPCHFLDMDKIAVSGVFEQFNHDILKYGSELVTEHWLKLYVMAEDRHLSTLYATKSGFKTAWVADAQFFYKPEKTWVDTLQQRIRWQGGTLAQQYVVVFRPAVISLQNQHWAWWYTALSALQLMQFTLCFFGHAIWCLITEYGREYSPIPSPYRDYIINGVIWANLIFPWTWVGWSSLINAGRVKYTDTISTLMIGLSLALSAASFIVCACSLFNPNNPNCADDDDDGEVTPIEDDLDDLLRDDDDYVAPCENLNWMKVLAIALTCLPIIAWLLMGPAVSPSIH